MKNKFYNNKYTFLAMLLCLFGIIASCEDDLNVRDGIRDVTFKATAASQIATEGTSIVYTDSSLNVTSRLWTFEGGSPATSDQGIVEVNYPDASPKDAEGMNEGFLTELSVTHDDGSIESNGFKVRVFPRINVDFSVEDNEVFAGNSVQFTNEITELRSAFIDAEEFDSFIWAFEGGIPATSTEENPVVTYNTLGSYRVTLSAHREAPEDNVTKSVDAFINVVEPIPLVPEFSANLVEIEAGETVVFTDETTGVPDAWAWTFAGGTPATSTEQNPSVVYDTAGVYDVTLETTRTLDGVVENISKTGYITVIAPCVPEVTNLLSCGNFNGEEADLSGWNVLDDTKMGDLSANLSIANDIFAPGGGSGSIKYAYAVPPAGTPGFTDAFIDFTGVIIDVTEAGSYTVTLDHYGGVIGGTQYVFNLGFVNTANRTADGPRQFKGRFSTNQWDTSSATIALTPGQYHVRVDIFNPGFGAGQGIDLHLDNITVVRN